MGMVVISDGDIDDLAHMYSPYAYFYGGIGEEEKFFPTPAETMLENSVLWRYDPSIEGGRVKVPGYTEAADKGEFLRCHSLPEDYLDLNGTSCSIDASVVAQQLNDRNPYYRVACFGYERKEYIVIQYWFFYIFEDDFFNHEGDWEVVQVLLDQETRNPIGVCISRDDDAEYRLWGEIERKGTHPTVYVAKGSHSGYYSVGVFSSGIDGADITSSDGWSGILFRILSLKDQSWLWFRGKWGVRFAFGCPYWKSGPFGPRFQEERWNNPIEWALSHYHNSPQTVGSPYTLFSLSCPADMLITNSAGQKLTISRLSPESDYFTRIKYINVIIVHEFSSFSPIFP